jgi:hypothetical protein
VFDLGYLGVEKDTPDQISSLPNKKRNQKDLSQEEKYYNQNHYRKGMAIEHTICRMKKYRIIIEEVFRNRLRNYDKVSDIVSWLVNTEHCHLFRWASFIAILNREYCF